MKDVRRDGDRREAADDLHRVLSTSILIFDTAITLLAESPPDGFQMPSPAHVACMRSILDSLGVGEEEDEVRRRRVKALSSGRGPTAKDGDDSDPRYTQ
jgi:hypothetical protein